MKAKTSQKPWVVVHWWDGRRYERGYNTREEARIFKMNFSGMAYVCDNRPRPTTPKEGK